MQSNLPLIDRLHVILKYDVDTGNLIWRPRNLTEFASIAAAATWNSRFAGKCAGTLHRSNKSKTSYIMVKVDNCRLLAHRVIWAMTHGRWPACSIDHIDMNGLNNKLDNLREASPTSQLKNRGRRVDNTSGTTGVAWHEATQKWIARISVDGAEKYLGVFACRDDAIAARVAAEVVNGYRVQLND